MNQGFSGGPTSADSVKPFKLWFLCFNSMSRIFREQVKKELCAMVDKAMDRKNTEVCFMCMIDNVY